MDEKRIDDLIRYIKRIDNLLEHAVDTLLTVSREVVPVGGATPKLKFVPPYISEPEWEPPGRRYLITQAMCCSTIQRLWLLHRRFTWLKKPARDFLEQLDEHFPKMLVPKQKASFRNDKDVVEYVRLLGSETFGALNPLTASWVFWVLMYAGEQYAHTGIGFFSFFSMLWALKRPYADPATRGAALEPWHPTAYITAKCLFPIEMIIGICRRRSRRFGEIARAVTELEALAASDTHRARWQFAFKLDELSSTLYETSVIAVDRAGFSQCAEALSELAGSLSSETPCADAWVAAKKQLAAMLRRAGKKNAEILDDARAVVEKGIPRLIDMFNDPARREPLLEQCSQFQGSPEELWLGRIEAADESREVCVSALEAYEKVTAACKKVKPNSSSEQLHDALSEVESANERVASVIERSIADPVSWCKLVVGKEAARASAGNETEFDPAELVNAMAIAVRVARDLPAVEIRDAVIKAMRGKRSDGSWAAGRPFYIYNRVLGAWSTTSDLMWTLATAIASHPEVDDADKAFLEFIGWLERTRTEVTWGPEKRRLKGWSSERFFEPKTIDIWATCGAINALLPIRTVLEYRLWEIAQQQFTIVEPSLSLAEIDPVDLAKPHRDRLHRKLLETGRATSGSDYRKASYALILHGPPGTSKTTLAGALPPLLWRTTQFAKRPEPVGDHPALVRITPADFMKGGEQNIDAQARMIFKVLTNIRGATIFFDEIDDLLRRRRLSEEPTFIKLVPPAMLNRLQDLRDACPSQQICFLIGTNFVDKLDPALIRPGRIDMPLDVPYPDYFSKQVIAEKMGVPIALIEPIAKETRFWPWAAFKSLCETLKERKTTGDGLKDVLGEFEAEADRAEFYYHDEVRWSEPNDRFMTEFVNCLSLHDDHYKKQIHDLMKVLEQRKTGRDLRDLEEKLNNAVVRTLRNSTAGKRARNG